MKRIAFFTPLNPQQTGVSDYSEALLPHLAQHVAVDVFTAEHVAATSPASATCPVYGYPQFEAIRRARRYDAIVYQMGNSPYHGAIYDTLLRYPGVTVLHDLVLHHFYLERTLEYGDTASYVRELAYARGSAGAHAATASMCGDRPYPYYEYPLYERVVDASRVVLVHNEYAVRRIATGRPAAVVRRAPLICDPRAQAADPALTAELRVRWQIPADALVIASFGQLDEHRRLDSLLQALAAVRTRCPNAIGLLVGAVVPMFDLDARMAASRQSAHVRAVGRVPLAEFFAAFDLADIAVNLRDPTAGETSATAIQLLGHGVPLIVSDASAYAELPDAAAIKIATGELEVAQLTRALLALAGGHAMRLAMREAARAYVARDHQPAHAVAAYLDAIELAARRRFRRPSAVVTALATTLGELGASATDTAALASARAALDLGVQ